MPNSSIPVKVLLSKTAGWAIKVGFLKGLPSKSSAVNVLIRGSSPQVWSKWLWLKHKKSISKKSTPSIAPFRRKASLYPTSNKMFCPPSSIKNDTPGSPTRYRSMSVLLSTSTVNFIMISFIINFQFIIIILLLLMIRNTG